MRKLVELSDIGETPSGNKKRHILEALDLHFGCLSYEAPLPKFKRARYVAPSKGWNHDHCRFCWSNFFELDDNGKGTLGWIVNDPGTDVPMKLFDTDANTKEFVSGAPSNVRDWACNECYDVISEWSEGKLTPEVRNIRSIAGDWRN